MKFSRAGLVLLLGTFGAGVVSPLAASPRPSATEPPALYGGTSYGGATYGAETYAPARLGADLAPAKRFIASLAPDHGLYTSLLRFVGDSSGRASMLARAADGGFFVTAARRTPRSNNRYANVGMVYRLDATGKVQWATSVADRGFATFEAMSVVATPDGGAIAQILAYPRVTGNPNQRFVKLDRNGRRRWSLQLPGKGDTDSPHAEVVRSDGAGGLVIDGYWVRASELERRGEWAGHMRAWSGAIDADGKLVRAEVGAVMTTARIGTWPAMDPFWDGIESPPEPSAL